ncbi:MAG: hypothetical protein AB7U61_01120 [Methylocystis sp.]
MSLLISKLVDGRQANWANSQLKHGGLPLWPPRHGGRDVHAHLRA